MSTARHAFLAGLFILALSLLLSARVRADELFAGGDGTEGDPFQITDCVQLQSMEIQNDGSTFYYYMLDNDIDCSETESWNDGKGFVPIGTTLSGFTGALDGNHKTISGLYVNDVAIYSAGLFSILYGSYIHDLIIRDGTAIGDEFAGMVAGAMLFSEIKNVHVASSTVEGTAISSGYPSVGGLVGLVGDDNPDNPVASIQQSSASGLVIGATDALQFVGGLVGFLVGATITDSYASSTVRDGIGTGGLVGFAANDTIFIGNGEESYITNSYAAGTASSDSSGSLVGGLVGAVYQGSHISYSFSRTAVSASNGGIGGLVGGVGFTDVPISDMIDASSTYFDAQAAGTDECVSGEESPTCTAVNTGLEGDLTDGAYFLGNNTNGPLPHFSGTYWTFPDGLPPQLRFTAGAPVISNVTVERADASVKIAWDTDVPSDSRVYLGLSSGVYATSTGVYDFDSPVTAHEIDISHAVYECTFYHFAVESTSVEGTATSTDDTFTVPGCEGNAEVSARTGGAVAHDAAGDTTLSLDKGDGTGITLTVPPGARGDDLWFQIEDLGGSAALDAAGLPSGMGAVRDYVYKLQSFDTNSLVLNSFFDAPLTVAIRYSSSDIDALDPSSLAIYTYDEGEWSRLSDCEIDTTAKTATCRTDHFSLFGLFGSPAAVQVSSRPKSTTSIQTQVANLVSMGNMVKANELKAQWYWLFPNDTAAAKTSRADTRDLEVGMTGNDVRELQALLNENGFVLARTGPGAPGQETTYFGALTRAAVAAYQQENGVAPAAGYFGPLTRASMKAKKVSGAWW